MQALSTVKYSIVNDLREEKGEKEKAKNNKKKKEWAIEALYTSIYLNELIIAFWFTVFQVISVQRDKENEVPLTQTQRGRERERAI